MTNEQIEKFAAQILRTNDYDAALALIERIAQASRAATVQDVLIDLKDDGQADAYDLIKSNY